MFNMSIEYLLIVLVIILFSMILHEIAHGLMALKLGDDTAKTDGRLTLNPIKHIDPILSLVVPLLMAIAGGPIFGGAKPVPINPYRLKWKEWGMALTAVAGPLTNFILAFIFVICLVIFHPGSDTFLDIFLKLGFKINMGFCIFNLIPIPPLDGSRILYALAPDSVRNVMGAMEKYGLIIVFAVIILFGSLFSQLLVGGIYGLYDVYSSIFQLTPLN
jgi:Zn-dependent protease